MELTSNNNCNSIYGTYTRSCKYGILIEYVRLQETFWSEQGLACYAAACQAVSIMSISRDAQEGVP